MWSSWVSQDSAKAKKAKKRAGDDGGAAESKGGEEDDGLVASLPAEHDEIQSDSRLSDGEEEEPMSCLLCGQVSPPARMLVVKWLICDQCLAPHHLWMHRPQAHADGKSGVEVCRVRQNHQR